jgi:hypothetical protein
MQALLLVGPLALGLARPASAQTTGFGDGLVTVQIGNITILKNAQIGVAADIADQICGLSVSNVAVLAEQVDGSGRERMVCTTTDGQDVSITN